MGNHTGEKPVVLVDVTKSLTKVPHTPLFLHDWCLYTFCCSTSEDAHLKSHGRETIYVHTV
jgi:hypothetical protein